MSESKLHYSKNTIGCRVGEHIYVHPDLKWEEPELFSTIYEHEKSHTDGFSKKDFFLDLHNEHLKGHKRAYYSFMLRHPRTWLGLLPITKIGKYWGVDLSMLILYLTFGLIGFFIWGKMV